jgi:hypothetical protein
LPFLLDVLLPPTLHPLRIPAQIVTPVLYQMWTGRSNVTRVGLIHLCTFLLLLLSGNRAFGVGLNKLFSGNLPADFPAFEGSHADLLVLVLHKLIVDGSPKLSTLYSCFLTIIANVSSYTKVRTAAAAQQRVDSGVGRNTAGRWGAAAREAVAVSSDNERTNVAGLAVCFLLLVPRGPPPCPSFPSCPRPLCAGAVARVLL